LSFDPEKQWIPAQKRCRNDENKARRLYLFSRQFACFGYPSRGKVNEKTFPC
jgi:hypothetical protein